MGEVHESDHLPGLDRSVFLVGLLGGGLLVTSLTHIVLYELPHIQSNHSPFSLPMVVDMIEVGFLIGIPLMILYTATWVANTEYGTAQQRVIARWCGAGALALFLLIGLLKLHLVTEGYLISPDIILDDVLIGTSLGGVFGFFTGRYHANELGKKDQITAQRDAFVFLNKLLRHNILNSINVIDGYTGQLAESASGEENQHYVETIQRRSQTIADLIQNVGRIAETFSGQPTVRAFNLSDLLTDEVKAAQETSTDATIRTEIPDDVYVVGNEMLHPVFDNLLMNAITNTDRPSPEVDISLKNGAEMSVVSISANGEGFVNAIEEHAFKPPENGDAEFELYLVNRLITYLDGSVWIDDNTPNGARLNVALPTAHTRTDSPSK